MQATLNTEIKCIYTHILDTIMSIFNLHCISLLLLPASLYLRLNRSERRLPCLNRSKNFTGTVWNLWYLLTLFPAALYVCISMKLLNWKWTLDHQNGNQWDGGGGEVIQLLLFIYLYDLFSCALQTYRVVKEKYVGIIFSGLLKLAQPLILNSYWVC